MNFAKAKFPSLVAAMCISGGALADNSRHLTLRETEVVKLLDYATRQNPTLKGFSELP
jgi:hypothetical protein